MAINNRTIGRPNQLQGPVMRCKMMIEGIFGEKFVATLFPPPPKAAGKWHFALAPMDRELPLEH